MRQIINGASVAISVGCIAICLQPAIAGLEWSGPPIPLPYKACAIAAETARQADVLCTGQPGETHALEEGALLPAALIEMAKGNPWQITNFHVDGAPRGGPLPESIRVVHFRREQWPAQQIADPANAEKRFLLALKKLPGGLFYLPPATGEMALGMKLSPERGEGAAATATEAAMLDMELANATKEADHRLFFGVFLSTRFWVWDSPRLQAEMTHLSESEDADVAGLALVWLLSRDAPGVLASVKKYLERKPTLSNEASRFVLFSGPIQTNVRRRDAVPMLIELTHSGDGEIKRAAYYALREGRHPEAARALGAGLYEDDLDIRYDCIMGLAMIANLDTQAWTTGVNEFLANPQPLTAKWREWWEERGRARYERSGQ